MRWIIWFLFFNFSFAVTLKEVNNTENLDFNSLYLLNADFIPYVLKHKNILLVGAKGKEKGVILTHMKKLKDINTVSNANLATKIILKNVNPYYKEKNASLEDFFKGKVDAIYLENADNITNNKDILVYHLDRMIYFPKKIIIGKRDYLLKHKNELSEFKENLALLWNGVMLSKYYYHDLAKMKDIFFYPYPKSKYIKVYVTKNWPPFDIYSNNHLEGIGIDFWKLIAKKANIDYTFVPKDKWEDVVNAIKKNIADVTPNTSETPDRKKFAYFSKPYVSFPLGILCNKKYTFEKISDIKSIAVGKDFTAEKLMKMHYPHIKYIETLNTSEALRLVENGSAQCVVDILPSLLWYLKKENINNMVLEFKTPFKFNLQVMISKENRDLVGKINEAIEKITPKEKKEIISKYSSVILVEKKVSNFNYLVFIIYLLIFLFLVYFFVRLKKRSQIDALTKIYNRGALEKELNKIIKEKSGSLLFFDLDNFKSINDTFGHEKGDLVLKEFSRIIKNNIRGGDVFGRWGGEEFILVLPEAKLEDGIKIAEKLRKLVEKFNFAGLKITVSIGVTQFKRGENLSKAVKRADENLYKAKRTGKNKVVGG